MAVLRLSACSYSCSSPQIYFSLIFWLYLDISCVFSAQSVQRSDPMIFSASSFRKWRVSLCTSYCQLCRQIASGGGRNVWNVSVGRDEDEGVKKKSGLVRSGMWQVSRGLRCREVSVRLGCRWDGGRKRSYNTELTPSTLHPWNVSFHNVFCTRHLSVVN